MGGRLLARGVALITQKSNRPEPERLHPRNGFTLLEASIVLVVISILMTVVVSALEPNDLEHLRASGDILAADLRLAQSIAVRDNTEMTLSILSSGWEIVHTGTGPSPELPSPLIGGEGAGYRINVAALIGRSVPIKARLRPTNTVTTSVSFAGTGRTVAVENTEFWLTIGTGATARSLPLTVAASTGLVTAGAVTVGQPPF